MLTRRLHGSADGVLSGVGLGVGMEQAHRAQGASGRGLGQLTEEGGGGVHGWGRGMLGSTCVSMQIPNGRA